MKSKEKILLQIEHLNIEHKNQFYLKNINLKISDSSIVFVCGYSGSGKTTLVEAICGYHHIKQGSISLKGKNIINKPMYECNFRYIDKRPVIFEHMSILENVEIGFRDDCEYTKDQKNEILNQTIACLFLTETINKDVFTISNNEKYLVALARSLLQESDLIILDEPFNNLDGISTKRIINIIKSYSKKGYSFLITSCNLSDAKNVSDHIYILENFTCPENGTYAELHSSPKSKYTIESLGEMYKLYTNIVEISNEKLIVGNVNQVCVEIPMDKIKAINITSIKEKSVILYIHYQKLKYYVFKKKKKITNSSFVCDEMYFECTGLQQLPSKNCHISLSLIGNPHLKLSIVISQEIQVGDIVYISLEEIAFITIEKTK